MLDEPKREDCCVCLHRTRRRTPCGHPLCRHCLQRLRHRQCPYCRKDFSFEFGREIALGEKLLTVTAPISRKEVELVRNCNSFDALHESVAGLAPRLAHSSHGNRQSFRSAVAKQCSEFLSGGWRSMLEAKSSARVLIGFMEDGVVEPSCALQSALVDCMLTLFRSSLARPPSGNPSRRPAGRAVRVSQPLGSWLQKTSLLVSFIDAKLLDDECNSRLCLMLFDELRRSLQDFTAQDVSRVAPELKKAADLLSSIGQSKSFLQVVSEALVRQEHLEGSAPVNSARATLELQGLTTGFSPVKKSFARPHTAGERPRPRGNLRNLDSNKACWQKLLTEHPFAR